MKLKCESHVILKTKLKPQPNLLISIKITAKDQWGAVMKTKIFPPLALLSLVCVACVPNPLAQKPAASSALNTPTPTPIPTQTSLQVVQKPTNFLPPPHTYELQAIDRQIWRRLTKITFAEDSIIVTMAITNGSKKVVMLNAKDGMYLEETRSPNRRYNLLPPSNNTQLMIKPGTTLKGKFVFVGWLAPQATALRLYSTIDSSGSSIDLFDRIDIYR